MNKPKKDPVTDAWGDMEKNANEINLGAHGKKPKDSIFEY